MRRDDAHTFLVTAFLLGWATTALAADALGHQLTDLPWAQIGIGALLSLWGGMTRTAEQMLVAIREGAVFHARAELARDVVVSSGVGFLVFAAGALQSWNVWVLGSALWCCGYAGTKFLGAYADKWSEKASSLSAKDKQ
jgi:hypothetical protein